MRRHVLTTLEGDNEFLLGRSIWGRIASGVSNATSSAISATKDAKIPYVSDAANAIRSGGNVVDAFKNPATPGIIPQELEPVPASNQNTLIFVGVAALALLVLVKR